MKSNAANAERISVLVCDPCPLISVGLQTNFENDPKIHILGDAPNLRTLHNRVATDSVDISLVDWSILAWHDHECINLIREITTHTFVVLLGMIETTRDRKRALELGVRGIISKSSTTPQIKKALYRVFHGGIWLERSAAETLLDDLLSPHSGPQNELQRIELLTRREREVIALVCRSLRNKEIAATLYISESTVWHHLTSTFAKLQVSDRLSLVTFALRHNLDSYTSPASTSPKSRPAPVIMRPRGSVFRPSLNSASADSPEPKSISAPPRRVRDAMTRMQNDPSARQIKRAAFL